MHDPAASTCREKAAASGSSFYYAFLSCRHRSARPSRLYAFCREVDDVVDEASDLGVAATKLAWWRQEVARAFAGTPQHPVMQALMPLVSLYGLEPSSCWP